MFKDFLHGFGRGLGYALSRIVVRILDGGRR